jgi:hypothetical protein
MPFDLHRNPFHLLEASPSDSLDILQEKHDDAILDGDHDEASLADALRRLTSPKTRIEAELSWILDQSAAQTRELLALLRKLPKSAGERDDWDSKLSGFSALSKANLLADIASRIGVGEGPLSLLCDAWDQISVDAVEASLADLRRKAAQAGPDRDMLATALEDLRRVHATAALAGMASIGGERRLMTALAERAVKRNQCGKFLSQLAERYDTASEPALAAISTRLETLDDEARATPGAADAVAQKIQSLLVDWDEINQPIQLLEQLRGHEEGRSRKLAQDLRALAIWLANTQDRHQVALTITEALLKTFPELDETAAQLAEDAAALRRLIEESAKLKPLRELEQLCDAAKRDPTSFMQVVREKGFTARCPGPVGEMARALQVAIYNTRGLEIEQAPWGMVFDLARYLIQQRSAGDVGHMMLSFMLGPTCSPSGTVKAVLRAELEQAAAVARKYRQSLTPRPPSKPSAPATPRNPVPEAPMARVDRPRHGAKVFWIIVALIVGLIIVMSNQKPKPAQWRTGANTVPSSTRAPVPVRSVNPVAPPPSPLAETIPSSGANQTLSIEEIRWCVFEGERIEGARPLINSDAKYEVNRFNSKVEFWNYRCSAYYYRGSQKQAVDNQKTAEFARLREEGRTQVRGWRLAAPAPTVPARVPAGMDTYGVAPAAPVAPAVPSQAQLDRALDCARRDARINFLGRLALSTEERTWQAGMRAVYVRECVVNPIPQSVLSAARVAAEAERDAIQTDALNLLSLRQSYARLDLRDVAAARRVQTQLRALGLYSGPIDGAFGRGSVAALRAFKRTRPELANDDVWDADTASALLNR